MILAVRHNWTSLAFGACLGLFITVVANSFGWSLDDIGWRLYDGANPVATIIAEDVSRQDNEIRATLRLRRHRGECSFVRPAAFQEFPAAPAVRVNAARVDAQPWVNVPNGMEFVALWRFWPVTEGGRLRLIMEYLCDGRFVQVEVGGLG